MNCRECNEHISDFIDGELDAARLSEFRAHLKACAVCHQAADDARAFSDALGGQIRGHAAALHPPAGAKAALLQRCESRTYRRRLFRGLQLAAASIVIALAALYLRSRDGSGGAERAELVQHYTQLNALKTFQDELAEKIAGKLDDPPLALVACAYLPAQRAHEILNSRFKVANEDQLNVAWPAKAELIVSLQRSIRAQGRTSELRFEQWSDGRVHVEHAERAGEVETVTKLDAGTWEILAAQNPELCRQLEIVDAKGRLIAGLPIPSLAMLRRDAFSALAHGAPSKELLKRLLELRLAPRVKDSAQMENELKLDENLQTRQPPNSPRPEVPLEQLKQEVRQLEAATGGAKLPQEDINEAIFYFRRLCSL